MSNPLMTATACWRRGRGMIALSVILLACLLLTVRVIAKPASFVPTGPGTISGRVTDETGVGLVGIEAALFRIDSYYHPARVASTVTDGNYLLAGLSPGIYYLRFRDPVGHYQTEYYGNVFTVAGATELVIAGNTVTGINATLAIGGQITGVITTLHSSLIRSELTLYQRQTDGSVLVVNTLLLAEAESTYAFSGLPPATYYLCVESIVEDHSTGYQGELQECYADLPPATPGASTPIAVAAAQIVTDINFVIDDRADRAAINGTVVTSVGEPISNTIVTLYRANDDNSWAFLTSGLRTNAAGRFTFSYLEPRRYALAFILPNGRWLFEGVPLNDYAEQGLPIDVTRPNHRQQITVTMTPATQITGVVTFFGQLPAGSGEVQVYKQYQGEWQVFSRATIDVRGHYTADGLYAGTYRVGVYAAINEGRQQAYYGGDTLATATDLTLTQGEIRSNINWDLGAGVFDSVITGIVTAAGNPLAGIRVELFHVNPEGSVFVVYTLTDREGHYRFDGLPQNVYAVRFVDPQNRYAVSYYGDGTGLTATSTLLYTDGTKAIDKIDGHLIPGGTIRGVIRRYNGTPVANAIVFAYFVSDQGWFQQVQEEVTFRSNRNGEYALTGLRPGLYRIGFEEEGKPYPNIEFYGSAASLQTASNVPVEAGQVTDGINIILGPDHYVWLPLLTR